MHLLGFMSEFLLCSPPVLLELDVKGERKRKLTKYQVILLKHYSITLIHYIIPLWRNNGESNDCSVNITENVTDVSDVE